ncbi:dolichyl pyrophosphate Glc1Man9GlcNAc2 alpha-1,3-glucosyltransferase [Salpingoeca rosetta]|uniref:Alpha-1,3-glucosyltransferase n=1 Tax=Salpingoeca rosetta (strain ATCC 50818 / BSB-021) TaxID=946362 RepID=F2U4M5_SALR5|nr:dolichyl pyrophosphate Glc1Man9GlcNAc2 alpha-1,3-glucosyltransferase [Salpingoeca rosetta]EGD82591.1 dolichyl pyrophosphate Glc1Man9GlcNAc2 alpha-1,3-glucosyltransferase [Salpingoeca rosetta]|eukprot:XP_004995827.1 dolichyl pyrophosphate Glc1Man9GlcNAc2 alpha-1,3-glucosyltransferase [Salpingoeca rosetta]
MTVVMVAAAAVALTFFKLSFAPSYRSTDFEVHRNWLAITWQLPISQWYTEATSQWTLDYPPFFAWFEYTLAHVAQFFDDNMLHVENLEYASENTILFQRLSVIAADVVLIIGTIITKVGRGSGGGAVDSSRATVASQLAILCSFGLLLVDHIHFQYNGFLFGILLIALAAMAQGHHVWGAVAFAALLNFKHIYVYVAPAIFVFLLRNYCFHNTLSLRSFSMWRFLQLGAVVLLVFALSFGPFVYMGQLPQVLSRLFPFKRGLCHAYWAANTWALYNALDKALLFGARKYGFVSVDEHTPAAFTGGLGALTCVCACPCLVSLFSRPTNRSRLYEAVALCGLASFLFGSRLPFLPLLLTSVYCALGVVYSFLRMYAHFLHTPAHASAKKSQ